MAKVRAPAFESRSGVQNFPDPGQGADQIGRDVDGHDGGLVAPGGRRVDVRLEEECGDAGRDRRSGQQGASIRASAAHVAFTAGELGGMRDVEAGRCVEVGRDLAHEALERQLAEEELRRLLVAA